MKNERAPTVSVIMNCYNSERFLKDAIDSVYAQSFQDWEIIFWDNASTDNSPSIAKRYDSRLRYYKAEQTTPLGEARNLAVSKASGQYLAFLDCDDLWHKNKLSIQIECMNKNNDAVLCFCNTEEYYPDGSSRIWQKSMINRLKLDGLAKISAYKSLLRIGCFIAMSSVLMKSVSYFELGGVDNNYFYVEDYDLWIRLSAKNDFLYIPDVLAIWRRHDRQSTCVIADKAYREHMNLYHKCLSGYYAKTDFYTKLYVLKKVFLGAVRHKLRLKR